MKRNILHILWAAAVIPLALVSCRQEVIPGETDGSDAQPFLITVTDGGYASETTAGTGKAGSRATENGYTTTFTAGDQCGLYIVRGTEIVYDNICLTATADAGGNLTWKAPVGTDLYGGLADEYYFLYYPYQTDMTDKVTVANAASADAAFFAPLISGWQPKADQSDYTDYTASDLMTATGTATPNADGTLSLSFPMAHRMTMAVIEMPGTVYKFTNSPAVPDYTIAASADFSSEDKPCLMSDGSYRYLVNPEAQGEDATLTGSYDNGYKEFSITPSIETAGNYKTYKVDGGYKEIEHTLQAGDFYLKDGTLLSKDAALTDAQKAACAGIVCWVDDATATDPALERDFPQCTHGLVVSLKETTSAWQNSYASTTIQSWAENQEFYTQGGYYALNKDVGSGYDSPGGIQGYNNTQILKAYNETFADRYPVTILNSFGTITEGVTLPEDKTSGWYLPSPKELVELYRAKEAVNQSLTASGGNPLLPSLDFPYYWSSGEDSRYGAWHVNLSDGWVRSVSKASGCYVRLVFAF
ncbi:fimbrillin family protein [Phocaeicola plebeius]|uniref:fimbrillin family protein n=1 Tax=Phocaeicola plebeius TaxID=310297 RepID=UPI0021AC8B72|nr:fimbrillin family protein [Phocaeicola plebeius]MCR8884698.1 fimbrillin family protein [Phocaeicola plebeius]MDM8286245.1 fimbrillin family protein [Phocaeicola plebeius]